MTNQSFTSKLWWKVNGKAASLAKSPLTIYSDIISPSKTIPLLNAKDIASFLQLPSECVRVHYDVWYFTTSTIDNANEMCQDPSAFLKEYEANAQIRRVYSSIITNVATFVKLHWWRASRS